MPILNLDKLRDLRSRAEKLLAYIIKDLHPFLQDDGLTFRRTPDSRRDTNDVNVTTTCSCIMALALTNRLADLYAPDAKEEIRTQTANSKASEAFKKVVNAPWMSSGLTENNAFTTSLVMRLLGFLEQSGAFAASTPGKEFMKSWDLNVGLKDPAAFATALCSDARPVSKFLLQSLTDSGRTAIERWRANAPAQPESPQAKQIANAMTMEMNRVVQGPLIYQRDRFPASMLSESSKRLLASTPTGYKIAELNRRLLGDAYPDFIGVPTERSLKEIAAEMTKQPGNFSIYQYPPAAAVVYWFIDGVDRAEINLPNKDLDELCKWASEQFNQQRSTVTAEHELVMDPVAMVMSACLCHRLWGLTHGPRLSAEKRPTETLPSNVELQDSVLQLFRKQTQTGIWPKYFPMFHYQEAGSNFCFTFEMIEAVLAEFGEPESPLFENVTFIEGLEKVVTWCEKNRLTYTDRSTVYKGWNSGGDINTLRRDQPESWATAVVHMALFELVQVLSKKIQRELLKAYDTKPVADYEGAWAKLVDVDVQIQAVGPSTVKKVLDEEIKEAHPYEPFGSRKIKGRRSVLLFGPPGTSKTSLVRAFASELGWPVVEIEPSLFLTKGIDEIYGRANEIFRDLADLSRVVVFFDEMDALVRTRGGDQGPLDIMSRFLTTSMLPKLAKLHDDARVVFFFATNYQDKFDSAIKRPGRFDILLCVWPPTWERKLQALGRIVGNKATHADIDPIKQRLSSLLHNANKEQKDILDRMTFTEATTFFESLSRERGNLKVALDKLDGAKFLNTLNDFGQTITLRPGGENYDQYMKEKNTSRYQ